MSSSVKSEPENRVEALVGRCILIFIVCNSDAAPGKANPLDEQQAKAARERLRAILDSLQEEFTQLGLPSDGDVMTALGNDIARVKSDVPLSFSARAAADWTATFPSFLAALQLDAEDPEEEKSFEDVVSEHLESAYASLPQSDAALALQGATASKGAGAGGEAKRRATELAVDGLGHVSNMYRSHVDKHVSNNNVRIAELELERAKVEASKFQRSRSPSAFESRSRGNSMEIDNHADSRSTNESKESERERLKTNGDEAPASASGTTAGTDSNSHSSVAGGSGVSVQDADATDFAFWAMNYGM